MVVIFWRAARRHVQAVHENAFLFMKSEGSIKKETWKSKHKVLLKYTLWLDLGIYEFLKEGYLFLLYFKRC